MRVAYLVFVGYALGGVVYTPGAESLAALLFIAVSCAPLLLAARSSERQGVSLGPPPKWLYWSIFGLGIANLALIAQRLGRSLPELFSLQGLAAVALSSTSRRYDFATASVGSGDPVLLALSLWLVFRAGASVDRMPKVMQMLAPIPIVLYTFATTEKWPTFLAGVFFFAGMFAAYPHRYALRAALRYVAVLGPTAVFVGGLAMVLRGSTAGVPYIAGTLVHYVLAPYAAFGGWLIERSTALCCTLGGLTFIGPLDATGMSVRAPGVFGELTVIHGRETNVYTAFRYLVQDFSIVGPLLIASWLTLAHAGLTMLGSTALARQLAGFTLFAAFLSLNVTPFVHNSVALAMVLSLVSILSVAVRLPPPYAPVEADHTGPGTTSLVGQ